MKIDNLKALFKKAADIASQVPDTMQSIAFDRALDLLSGEKSDAGPTRREKGRQRAARRAARTEAEGDPVEKLLREMNRTKYPLMNKLPKVLDRSLLLLRAAKDDFQIDGLTAPQIAKVLTDKFRKSTTRQAVEMAVKNAGHLVDRTPVNRGFKYRIMEPGEKYLDGLLAEIQ